MATKVYGASDDLIEFEGDFKGEVNSYADDEDRGALVLLSDGTVLKVHYGDQGIWKIQLLKRGTLYERIDQCVDEDARPHSDVAYFAEGIKWAYVAEKWEAVY